jgi:flagellar biosynthetic protein FliR
MTELYRFSETEMLLFCMLMLRLSAFVVTWPVFGQEMGNHQVKVLFALILAMVLFPTMKWNPQQAAVAKADLFVLSAREIFVGLSLGFLARFFFFSFRVAGEMIAQAMGLSSAQMFNPAFGGQTTSVEQFYVAMASLFYLAVNGHHYLISALVRTLDYVPVAQMTLNTSQFPGVANFVQEVIELGLKFSAPVVISILVVNLILGVVGKTVPQLNVLVTSFPINIMIGLFLMIITFPMLLDHMGEFLDSSTLKVFEFVKAF